MPVLHRSRPAMASTFELILSGDDPEHLDAVASEALEEVGRVERLLSRHDPAAEVARLNRDAAVGPVLVDVELFDVLRDCLDWSRRTGGAFDPCAPTGRILEDLRIEAGRRAVRFGAPGARIDLGAYGKGYAVDRAADRVASYGVAAMLQVGTSSARGLGSNAGGRPWVVALRDPFAEPPAMATVDRFVLTDRALSCSAVFGPGSGRSDLLDPVTGSPLERPAACAVIADTATEAEVLSTALLVMGRERAREFVSGTAAGRPAPRVAWIEQVDGTTVVEWWAPTLERIR
ncbi:FAD:protein FMN transferase [Tautonia plasticadhaerens]|uniref:FAD:protein FMN transferase n=1 Tax=Tautonia plasticadhaerens TaxID=2527974 RepID=A0A518GXG7_9BACT|nr:FAD:protein FMN transferase [Tautonia plasticadhaerens]QDV33275.1 Thiamine biosynthesis lipoprotein ApbE precursor [Tautonia plasticadhaerens]